MAIGVRCELTADVILEVDGDLGTRMLARGLREPVGEFAVGSVAGRRAASSS